MWGGGCSVGLADGMYGDSGADDGWNKNEMKKLIFCTKDKTVFIYKTALRKELLLFSFGIKFLIKYNVPQPS